jgi:phage terminase Nu1 subunit (DNA packaging protein)
LKNKDSDKNTLVATTKEISAMLGLSDRRIRQLADEGALVRISHGKFDLPASIQTYIKFLVEKEKPDSELNKSDEEALWTRARRQKTELELQIMRGELHRSGDVESVMNDMLGAFRARLLSLPSKIAPQMQGKTEIPAIKEILKDAVHEALNELSDYDPDAFFDYSKDKLYLDEEEIIEDTEVAKQVDKEPKRNGPKKKK